jgi:TrwC relaxase/AAA domain
MAVVLKINPGFDASYPWREIGTGQGEPASPLDYYLAPTDKGGEPPGRWAGRGLAVLGFTEGQAIDRQVFEPLFGQHTDPQDSSGKTRLGRAPQRFASEDDIFAELVAAEPHASEARKAELRALARAQARHAVPFWDITVSVSKSITLLYGGLLAKAEHARQAGDFERAARWEQQAAKVWAAIMEGNTAALEYLQDEAGLTRTGYHRGSGAESRAELGIWEHARDWVIGSFRQHTSRTGDPQLHVHNLVLAKVATERDGKWRKLDSRSLYRFQGAAAAIAAAVTETALTRDLGVAWVPRADGHGREIAGISQELMDAFSSRRQTIVPEAKKVADEREREHGRRPDARQMYRIQKDIALRTRPPKPEKPLDIRAKLREWEATARAQDLGELAAIPDAVEEAARERGAAAAEADSATPMAPDVAAQVARSIAAEFTRQQGRAPEQAELETMERFASFVTRRGTDTRPVDAAVLLRGWQAQERRDAQARYEIRRDIARAQAQAGAAHAREQARERALEQEQAVAVAYPVRGGRALTEEQARRVMAEAVATVQAKMPTWTKADLIRYLGETLPAEAIADRATLETLATCALAGGAGEQVVLLSAPEWPRVPDCLRRADGESVFRPHGAERYASHTQLTLEERLLAQAQESAGPRLDPAVVARMLGAEQERLEAQLRPEQTTAAALIETTGSGLRMDQAAAAYFLLTSPRRAEVMVGPPGTGKTRAATEMARIWADASMGPVVALTTSSNARNVIQAEAAKHGVTLRAYNTAEWLGHSQAGREARPPVGVMPGTLLIVDEASMMSLPDLAAIVRRAAEHGAKVVITGDPMQIQAVESGGAMTMLAHRLGHVQLSEPGRFRHAWEGEASQRLRDGDVTALAAYREHGRLYAGYAEDVLEDAARAYLHDWLNGKDALLMAATEGLAAELARRVRGDLIRWGLVSDGPTVRLRDGARASAGDQIMARRNQDFIEAGEPGRGLANRDILRIVTTSAGPGGWSAQVERLTRRDPVSGQEQWSAPFLLDKRYLWEDTHLAYAVTFHSAEGRTVDSGIAVFTGEEDRQAVNVALSRGRDRNDAYVIGGWRLADPGPGSLPAAELARQDRLDRENAGLGADWQDYRPGREAITAEEVLGKCLARDGQQRSATDTREAEWSDADRLDVLGVQWQHVMREASQHRYEAALHEALTDEQVREVVGDSAATWLWRSLRAAEAAGLDGPAALRRAVAAAPLADAESVAKVLDWRVRQQIAGMPAVAARPWAEQVPQTGDADMDRYARELAAAMEDRQRRLGEHAAEHQPAWTHALGRVSDHPLDRAGWEHKAGLVAKYRERWGYAHPHEPIGPRPGQHSPDARGDWQAAAEALGYAPGDLHEHSDGQLWAWRSAFAREMEWAPPYKGDDLATVRAEIRRTQIEADRARRNAEAAEIEETRQRLIERAVTLAQWEQMTRDLADRLAEAQAGYDAWEAVSGPTRERAVAADAELRRRHPEQHVEPLRAVSTRPQSEPAAAPARDESVAPEPETQAGPDLGPHADKMDRVAARLREISARLDEASLRKAQEAREKAAEITSLHAGPEDPEAAPVAAWKSELEARQREAVRHEPMPRVPAAEAIAAPQAGIPEREAAD